MTAVEPELVEEMFVQVARATASGDGILTLNAVSPRTLYFSDRPERVVGHMTNDQFVSRRCPWPGCVAATDGDADFRYVPPG